MRSLLTAILLAIIAACGYYCLGIDRSGLDANTIPVESQVLDQATFYRQTVEQINTAVSATRFPDTADSSLTKWLEKSADVAKTRGNLATQELLEKLSTDVPQISSATACVAYAGSVSSLSESIAKWVDEIDPSFSHFATHIFADASSQ